MQKIGRLVSQPLKVLVILGLLLAGCTQPAAPTPSPACAYAEQLAGWLAQGEQAMADGLSHLDRPTLFQADYEAASAAYTALDASQGPADAFAVRRSADQALLMIANTFAFDRADYRGQMPLLLVELERAVAAVAEYRQAAGCQ